MRLRPHRRNLVVWSSRSSAAPGYGVPLLTRPARPRRIRRCLRAWALLTVIGLVGLARGVHARWRPMLAGVVLTGVGFVLRNGPGGLVMMPGLMFLLLAPLQPASPKADRGRSSELARELGAYSTSRQRQDLEATLDRYPDGITYELRDILTRQVIATGNNGFPGTSSN